MYLDDGISRDSAPKEVQVNACVGEQEWFGGAHKLKHLTDPLAKDKYTKVIFHQVCQTKTHLLHGVILRM